MRKYNCDLCKIDADSITNLDLQEYVIYLRNKTKLDDHPFKPTEDKHITNTSKDSILKLHPSDAVVNVLSLRLSTYTVALT